MKKILTLILLVFTIWTSFSFVNANKSVENYLYKNIIITDHDIKNQFWENILKYLNKEFAQLRLKKDKKKLVELQNRTKPIVEKLNNKNTLTRNEKALHLLAKNIFFRSKLLHDYLIK